MHGTHRMLSSSLRRACIRLRSIGRIRLCIAYISTVALAADICRARGNYRTVRDEYE